VTSAAMAGRVSAVCIVHTLLPEPTNPDRLTAIDKRPIRHAVPVGPYGLGGDLVKDHRHHGGIEQAVYAYADEDAAWWGGDLGITLPPGTFGENLRTHGIDVTGAEIGERWRIGTSGLELELTCPRIPCATFARRMSGFGVPQRGWVKRFARHGAPGAYFAVSSSGTVTAGDEIEVVHRPGHGITLGQTFLHDEPETWRPLLKAEEAGTVRLYDDTRAHARRVVAARG